MSPDTAAARPYDPKTWRLRTFHDAVAGFRDGSASPRDYLEGCLADIAAREDSVQAFAYLDADGARKAADPATERYRAGRPLSLVDGLPIGVQLQGARYGDERLTACARWIAEA